MINITEKEIMRNWQGDISEPVVSICCITYNHEKYIEETIDSFLMQETNFPFEIVLGEDCSTDNTRKIVEKYKENYPNIIKLIVSENNVGMQANGQRTMEACRGKYVALCEGDDYWTDKKKLQIQIDEMNKYPEIGISFHLAGMKNKTEISNPTFKDGNKIYSLKKIICGDFHLVQTNTIVFKKKYLKNLDFELLSKSPVGDVWLRVACSIPNGALFINKNMSVYRIQSDGSWSQSIQEDEKFIAFITKMIQSIDNFDKYWEYKYTSEFKFYKNIYINIVIKKNISQKLKKDFIEKNKNVIFLKNKILWILLYKNKKLVDFLKKIKQILKGY